VNELPLPAREEGVGVRGPFRWTQNRGNALSSLDLFRAADRKQPPGNALLFYLLSSELVSFELFNSHNRLGLGYNISYDTYNAPVQPETERWSYAHQYAAA